MPFITLELLKRKAEHHDGPLSELEELSLHQLELERIDVVGTTCRRLRILYLQNNVIPRLENLHHLKELRYLNVALNNITAIEGLGACEFLEKLDMTVNFVDVDALEAGVAHLAQLAHLADVYLIGNPAAQWAGYRSYVVHALPALRQLDGVEVTRAERIHARQAFPQLRDDLRVLAAAKAAERAAADAAASATAMPTSAPADGDASAPWTPEARAAMYREVAEQKAADDARRRGNEPRARDAAAEHATAVAAERAREAAATAGRAPPQCNTGKWQFAVDDDGGTAGTVALRLGLPRFVDSSLVDVDVHPAFVAVVAKGKVFRLHWPEEVRADEAKCQRSQTTGELLVTVPVARRGGPLQALHARRSRESQVAGATQAVTTMTTTTNPTVAPASAPRRRNVKLGDEILELCGSVSLHVVRQPPIPGDICAATEQPRPLLGSTLVDVSDGVPPLE